MVHSDQLGYKGFFLGKWGQGHITSRGRFVCELSSVALTDYPIQVDQTFKWIKLELKKYLLSSSFWVNENRKREISSPDISLGLVPFALQQNGEASTRLF